MPARGTSRKRAVFGKRLSAIKMHKGVKKKKKPHPTKFTAIAFNVPLLPILVCPSPLL